MGPTGLFETSQVDALLLQAAGHYRAGQMTEAERIYRKALQLCPQRSDSHVGLAVTLFLQGRTEEAIEAFRRALEISPDDAGTLYKFGNLLLREGSGRGRIAESFACFQRHARLTFTTDRNMNEAPHRIRHDQEQLDYLARAYGLNRWQFHLADGRRISSPSVNSVNAGKAVEEWNRADPRIIVIDNLLSLEALDKLRSYCWGSTIWRETHSEGYLTAMPEHGLACPLIAQIDEDMRAVYPEILGRHELRYLWAFKYDSRLKGVGTHADPSMVTFNFWITADEANLDPESGGLTVWDAVIPPDWNTKRYITDTAACQAYLARVGARPVTIPYRCNRAVVFASNLFHQTDRMLFKEGYTNRRINITMLYGRGQ